ncbi:MAG: histidine kinase, partial [Bacteroidota bacterium]
VVTFNAMLRSKLFPLPQILDLILDMGTWGMGTPVELEFASNLAIRDGKPKEFALLQLRPLVVHREQESIELDNVEPASLICRSSRVLGDGIMEDIHDIVLVDYHKFERSRSRDVAKEVSYFNAHLIAEERPYLLVGVGRWGSLDPWLGIPVTWEQIAGAKAIVETGFKELSVAPSQGSHFFHNITSFMIGYFTVHPQDKETMLDWDWLLGQQPNEEKEFTRHIRFDRPLLIRIDGHKSKGIILKPEEPG